MFTVVFRALLLLFVALTVPVANATVSPPESVEARASGAEEQHACSDCTDCSDCADCADCDGVVASRASLEVVAGVAEPAFESASCTSAFLVTLLPEAPDEILHVPLSFA